jgi:hypothetical protein
MRFSKKYLSVICSAILAGGGLAACSSGGGSAISGGFAKVTSGVITGFGSVFVNGVEYQTGNATVKVDGADGSENDLAIGMVVKVKGEVNSDGTTGSASSIEFNDETQGSVMSTSITNGAGTLNVMGQTVNVDADTVFESQVTGITSIDMVQPGNIVEVSGYSNGSGTIYATRVEVKSAAHTAGEAIEVKGKISNLDTTAMTFTLGDPASDYVTVDYGSANLVNFPAGGIANDQFVEVTTTTDVANNLITATKVEMKNADNKHIEGNEGDVLELEGVVTADLANSQFMLNDQIVVVDDATELENGSLADVVMGAKLAVEGQLDADGNLLADQIKFREEASAEMFAPVDAVSADSGTLTAMGVEIQVNTLTRMADEQDENNMTPVRYFGLADVAQGDWLEVHYYQDTGGNYVATEIKRENAPANTSVTLSGTIDSVQSSSMMVSGINVDVSSIANATYSVGQNVEIHGSFSGGTLMATSVSLSN